MHQHSDSHIPISYIHPDTKWIGAVALDCGRVSLGNTVVCVAAFVRHRSNRHILCVVFVDYRRPSFSMTTNQ